MSSGLIYFRPLKCIIAGKYKIRQRPTFPGSLPPSIIGAIELNFRVRDGNGWNLYAIVTGYLRLYPQN